MPTLRRTPTPSPTTNRPQTAFGLISVRDLIKDSWETFKRHWKHTFSISLWLLIPAIVLLLASLLSRFIQPTFTPLLSIISLITGLSINAWVNLRLIQYFLKEEGETSVLQEPSWTPAIGSYIWVEILYRIALIGASLPLILGVIGLPILAILAGISEGAFFLLTVLSIILLSLPIIWLLTQLVFWPFVLMTHPEGSMAAFTFVGKNHLRVPSFKKSVQLLSQSHHLVRTRFWTVFARLIWPGLTFLLLFLTVTFTVDTLFALVVGEQKMSAIFETIPQGYGYFLVSIGQVLFLPLFITWLTKLFRSLKQNPTPPHAA